MTILHQSHPVLQRLRRQFELLYGQAADECLARLIMLAGRYDLSPHTRPAARRWSQADILLITYGDMVQDPPMRPLAALKQFMDQRLKNVFTWAHVLPFFPYSSDDGFSVVHYRSVNPDLGTWEDIHQLRENFDLAFDLVLNHVSAKSGWFSDYQSGVAPGRHYFINIDPDADWSSVVRPRCGKPYSAFATPTGMREVWTTFSRDQVDLNYAHPDVLFEMLDLLMYYIAMGARMIRLDAVAYLWKKAGSACIHLPETHEIVRIFHNWLALIAPDVRLLTETNVPQPENLSYFGGGDEAHLIYQFTLPPLLLHTMLTGNTTALTQWAMNMPNAPDGCTFLNFTASHDGIGVRPLEGLLSDKERADLCAQIKRRGGLVSMRRGTDGAEYPYELNITWFDAMADAETPANAGQATQSARFLCSQIIAMELKGIPAIYLHSLTATPNDIEGAQRSGQARAINRRKWMVPELEALLKNPSTTTAQVFTEYTRLLKLRAQHPAFAPDGHQRVFDANPGCFAVERTAPDESEAILCLSNCTAQTMALDLKKIGLPRGKARDLLRNELMQFGAPIRLAPYQTIWLTTPAD